MYPGENNISIISMYYILSNGDGISDALGFPMNTKEGEGK
jgi:hypothetical protein